MQCQQTVLQPHVIKRKVNLRSCLRDTKNLWHLLASYIEIVELNRTKFPLIQEKKE